MLQYYVDSLSDSDKDKVNIDRSSNSFKFGNSKMIRSNRLIVTIPVFAGCIQAKLTANVTDYEIPLLLSKDSMRRTNAMIDFTNDKIIIFQKTVDIIYTDSNHYGILLNNLI